MKAKTTDLDTLMIIIRKYGWTMTSLKSQEYNHDEMLKWLNSNCKGSCRFIGAAFAFQDPGDALVFKLVHV